MGHTRFLRTATLRPSVHPHLRGAYSRVPVARVTEFGSSPHTWGIRSAGFRSSRQRRFIPTYVGHTMNSSRTIRKSLPVHPHIRGAYWQGLEIPPALGGSSPHTWGIRVHHPKTSKPLRFIPTYVGHTVDYGIIIARKSVHPHIRGAYTSSIVRQHGRAVHPHIRGAYHYFLSPFSSSNGSSPHTWGIL